jgi:glycosyltransferase involved in cell wall biosynthesis
MPLRVALNATPLLAPLTGIGNYILHLGQALAATGDVDLTTFRGYSWRKGAPIAEPDVERPVWNLVKPFVPWKRELRQSSQRFAFEQGIRRYGIELYHEPNYVPIPTDVPFVTTIHDLSWLRYPETHPIDRVRWLEKGFPRTIEQARAILVDSEFVRNEVLATYSISPERVHAVHLGAGDEFRPRTSAETGAVLRLLGLTHGTYLLAVGTIEPRKNLVHILESHALLPTALRQRFPLVIAGAKGWHSSGLLSRLLNQNDPHVRFLGHVEPLALADLYAGAALFAFPSIYEGFGLPPLEAMASGVPVIVSNRASLPEIVGSAGQMMDPDDPAGTAAMIKALLEDPARRAEMSRLGVERASQFTWAACAKATLSVYQAALDNLVPNTAELPGGSESSETAAQDAVK